jgi:hypothetical protein
MQKTKLLNEFAYDENGMLTTADKADKTKKYTCPACNRDFILKKSNNPALNAKCPHFAHYNLTECTPEGVLHCLFKTRLFDIIQTAIINKRPIPFAWNCKYCNEKHGGNLLKRVSSIKQEFVMDCVRPDIALFDENEKLFAVIEVVVTHKPEDAALSYYKRNNVIIITIIVESYDDYKNIEDKISNPNSVDFCSNQKCQNCGRYSIKKRIFSPVEPCYECKAFSKEIIWVKGSFNENRGDTSYNKEVFLIEESKEERLFVSNGGYERLATCGKCKAFFDDKFFCEYCNIYLL